MVFKLDDNRVGFPDPRLGEEDGLLAVGGALTPDWLITAYSYGIFPWYGFKESPYIEWWCPMQRFVIFPEEIHISHSMKQMIKSDRYAMSVNKAFDEVIENCAKVDGRYAKDGAWLGEDMMAAYKKLHQEGFAISIEVWDMKDGEKLIGGLYGINIGKNFFGESMFSLAPSGSKLALITLAQLIGKIGGIIDCQFETPHLKSMGGRTISYEEYMERMKS